MKRMMIGIALFTAACSGPSLSEKQRDEVDDVAEAAVSESAKVRDIESRIDELEARVDRANIPQ
jgi:hypothetical protein